jgi:ubiquinone/menaquinone biosynthesis C-methylase UbiE
MDALATGELEPFGGGESPLVLGAAPVAKASASHATDSPTAHFDPVRNAIVGGSGAGGDRTTDRPRRVQCAAVLISSRVLEPEVMDDEVETKDYDAMNHGEVNARFVSDLLELPVDCARTLDVGTGTARIPIELCGRRATARVTAVDMAWHMLRVGLARVEQAALSGVIALERRDAKALGFPPASFTCVMSNSLLHHLPDPAVAVVEMTKALAPSGWLFLRDLVRPANDGEVVELLDRHAAGENARQRALFEASLRAALSLGEIAEAAARAGIAPGAVRKTSDRHWTLAWNKR